MQVATMISTAQMDDSSIAECDLIAAYENGVEVLRNTLAGITVDQARCRPIPNKWSTLEVVCHLADSEQFFADRIKRTIAMDRPLLIGVDPGLYAESLHYQEHNFSEELDLVSLTRRQMARTLKLVTSDAWRRTAVHSETGLVTLRQLVFHAINHLNHHLRFVNEKRVAMKNL